MSESFARSTALVSANETMKSMDRPTFVLCIIQSFPDCVGVKHNRECGGREAQKKVVGELFMPLS